MDKNTRKNIVIAATAALVVIVACAVSWNIWFSATRIGFLNFRAIELGQISKANNNSKIKIKDISVEDLKGLESCDMLFINGMGLHITEENRAAVNKAGTKGLAILTVAATNPDNDICTIDDEIAEQLSKYLEGSTRANYRSMLNYVRKAIDHKSAFTDEIAEPVTGNLEMIYHPDLKDLDNENLGFDEYGDYKKYLEDNGLWNAAAPRIMITGQMGEPSELIVALEKSGDMVFPVRDFNRFVREGLVDSIAPSAIINMAHGRMGDKVVKMLEDRNIPLFSPLNVNTLASEWKKDKMGMSGGFLSQSVVTPEIDGAIRPFALFGHYLDEEGLPQTRCIPERLGTFVETVNNHISLQQKSNSEKKVAIVYYKGAGQSALTAAGMEVIPSMYNFLKELRSKGYKVENLPSSLSLFKDMVMHRGRVFGTYAEGAASDFMETANPVLVNEEEYTKWVAESMPASKYEEVTDMFGPFPGSYMSNDKGELAVARIDLGNVVLLPQPAAGIGSDTFKMVHGTDEAPTHAYIAPYLWIQHGFKADAMIHFGTHGSLEFTPRKQVALSDEDWPDILVGALPHYYIYTISNVGEAMIAKRRSYGVTQSYLTPPFMESSLRGTYRELSEAIRIYNNSVNDAIDKTAASGTTGDKRAESLNQNVLQNSLKVKELTVKMGIHRELQMDSTLTVPYTEEEIARIENFAEEIATEKITGQLYTMGEPYEEDRITSSVYAMTVEPIAYSLLSLDKLRGKAVEDCEKHKSIFSARYLEPSRKLVRSLLRHPETGSELDKLICRTAGISRDELKKAREIEKERNAPKGMMAMMMAAAENSDNTATKSDESKPAKKKMPSMMEMNRIMKACDLSMSDMKRVMKENDLGMKDLMGVLGKALKGETEGIPAEIIKIANYMNGGKPQETPAQKPEEKPEEKTKEKTAKPEKKNMMMMAKGPKFSKEEMTWAMAVTEVERAMKNVGNYRIALRESPANEFKTLINSLNGGYTAPSPGGDPIVNPNTLPTGRNLYAINAEETPTESAWDKGKRLAQNTIDMYKRNHNDSIPRKVSYTLWSGEFIETEGATIAQILYMLGVEPIRDAFGRVNDIRLIPSKELGRPRIDVVVQTSGQLRDIAASRLFLINRAVEMAAAANDDIYTNQVYNCVIDAEKALVAKGVSPKEAREMSTFRVFGGVNGNYGTGITGMVQSGDRWESEEEIAETYLNNMGAFYGDQKHWENMRQYAFEAALTNTDAVIQPRQSNTWGALSLDHVYEFMGGMNLAVRNVTGKDPDAYLSDYRNRNNVRMQELKESIGVESRTTIFNPHYIKEKMKGDATSASTFDEIIQNTYGWNVMKPEAVDDEMWDEIYEVYVKDKFNLGVQEFFERANPASLQDMTAVMMETARKGLWNASDKQLADIANLHTELVQKYNAACTGAVCDNAKLQDFIASKMDQTKVKAYRQDIREVREKVVENNDKGMVMKKEKMNNQQESSHSNVNAGLVAGIITVLAIAGLIVLVIRRRKANS